MAEGEASAVASVAPDRPSAEPSTDGAPTDYAPTDYAPTERASTGGAEPGGAEPVDATTADPIAIVQALFPGRVVAVESEPEPVATERDVPALDGALDPQDVSEASLEADDERPDGSG